MEAYIFDIVEPQEIEEAYMPEIPPETDVTVDRAVVVEIGGLWYVKGYREGKEVLLFGGWEAMEGHTNAVLYDAQGNEVPHDLELDPKSAKLREIGDACTSAIYAGVEIETTQGLERFSLTNEDQINIGNLALQAQEGLPVLYHADGELCRLFAPEEMLALAAAAVMHKTYHTTLCNHLNVWIRRSETPEELDAIHYGADLPNDLAASFALLMGGMSGG